MPASYETHRKQLQLILQAWGMPEATAAGTAEIMSWADLHGIDTHGISMVPPYDERRQSGKIDMKAVPKVVKETPVSALVDGGGGLGHPNGRHAMELAIDKAKKIGIGVAVVRNSAHFGACGFYALMPVEQGLIGMVTTSASGIQVAPTNGAQARLGTDPIAFGAPGKPGEPFLLDMATTTVAARCMSCAFHPKGVLWALISSSDALWCPLFPSDLPTSCRSAAISRLSRAPEPFSEAVGERSNCLAAKPS